MPSELHEQLCLKAVTWLKKHGFPVSAMNVWAAGSRERLDCIGYRQQCSVLIEVKVSRSDFRADFKKPERRSGGVGTYRFYLAPAGMIDVTELPKGWGLLEFDGKQIAMVQGPLGNLWPSSEYATGTPWEPYVHAACKSAEIAILYSIARRAIT